MPKPADALVTRVQERAAREPAFATVLEAILEAPPADTRQLTRAASRQVNDVRRQQVLADFREGALPTAEVKERLGRASVQSVHVLRSRGQLIGRKIGNATWFPAWQLQGDGLRDDLPRLLDALGRFTDDAVAADRVMRLRRDELGGKSIGAALDDPKRAATAWNLLDALGG